MRPQGWESAFEHLRGAAAAVAAVMPAASQADPTSPGKPKTVGVLAPGLLAGPNVSTPVTILSLETGELEVSLVAQAPHGAPNFQQYKACTELLVPGPALVLGP